MGDGIILLIYGLLANIPKMEAKINMLGTARKNRTLLLDKMAVK
jgi:hypothetical protein